MRELRALGLTDDGKSLVLVDLSRGTDGERFRVSADERLRAALRSGAPRAVAAQAETRVESALTPREIQARLRAGATAEEVAKAAGIPVGRVQRYEAPILAERARVVSEARRASAPGPHRQTPGRPLGTLVDDRLEQEGQDPESVEWDAKRRPDGTWLVTLAMTSRGPARATWSWDPQARRVRGVDAGATAVLAPMPAPTTGPDSLTAVAEAAGVTPDQPPTAQPEVARQAIAVGDDAPRRSGGTRTGGGRPGGLVVLAGRGEEPDPARTNIDLSDSRYDADVPGGVPHGTTEPARSSARAPLPDALLPGTAPSSSLGTTTTRPEPGVDRPSRQERLPADVPSVDVTSPATAPSTSAAPATAPSTPTASAPTGSTAVDRPETVVRTPVADETTSAEVPVDDASALGPRKPNPANRTSTARRRSAVPAWDDIMFGARRG